MRINICLIHIDPFSPKKPADAAVFEIYGKGFPSFGHNVTWITSSANKEIKIEEIIFKDIHIYTIPKLALCFPLNFFNSINFYIREYKLLIDLLKKERFDIIQVRDDVFSSLLVSFIKKIYKIPFVFQYSFPKEVYKFKKNNNLYLFCIGLFENFILKYIFCKADLIFPISKWMEEELIKKGIPKSKMMTLPMGVNPQLFHLSIDGAKIRQKYGLESTKIILYIGTMDQLRKLDMIIHAFSKIKGKCKYNFKLLMVGDGNDKSNLEKLSKSLGLENDILFTGEIPYFDVPNYIAASDICLCPVPPLSIYKVSSPTKLFEYMAMKKPVLANEEIPEQKEVIQESGGGLLVEFNEKSFAEGMMKLFNNPETAKMMGERGYEWVVENRSYDNMAREVERKYYEILETYNKS